jgi:glycine/D-amino acid oxidase-like deaminating enzyme/nitrite reductase/ring-hydroxylating ferredoxin subunit
MAEIGGPSHWLDSSSMPRYPKLDRDLTVDVVVIGAGMTGLSAAYLLKKEQLSVAVIDRDRAGGVDTSRTTAHVTCVTDLDLSQLVGTFGRDHAMAAWDAGLAAIDQIDRIVRAEGIECEWSWVKGYRHAPHGTDGDKECARLKQEAALAAEMGFDARYLDSVPFMNTPGVEYAGQAKFHPRKYLAALAERIHGAGSHIFEHTACEEVRDEPLAVQAGGHRLSCRHVVIATHTPLMGKAETAGAIGLQTKLYLYTSYVVGGRLPPGTVPEALFWDTADPYHYLRIDGHRGFDYAIVGGEDHKTGQADDTTDCFARLETRAHELLPGLEVAHRWSGQVVETNDGLPFIGETSANQFVATGYAGNGMTFGTLAALMARDTVLGRRNPWQGLFDAGRTTVRGGAWNYLRENADYPYYKIRDRFAGADGSSVRSVGRGEGKVLDIDGRKVAVSRDDEGVVTQVSAICTHLGCTVAWNAAERTWDCPCHGSRFKANGAVIAGPAQTRLERS